MHLFIHLLFLISSSCWIKYPAFYFFFLIPVAMIMLLNCTVFVLVLRQIISASDFVSTNYSSKSKLKTRLRGAMIMIILLGLTYLFAVFAVGKARVVFYYLFVIFNTLQGLFIFIFYCVYKVDSYNAWSKKLHYSPESSRYDSISDGNYIF